MTQIADAPAGPSQGEGAPRLTTRAAFFTDTHRIEADVDTRQRRLVEILRDPARSFLNLTHVSLSRAGELDPVLATSAAGILRKADIQFVAIMAEPDRASKRLYGYVDKTSVRVLAMLPSYGIEGGMHLPEGSTDGLVGYQKLQDTFIHMTSAQIRFTSAAVAPWAADTVIINRLLIELFCLVA